MPIRRDLDDKSKVHVLHGGKRVGWLRIKRNSGGLQVTWAERTASPGGSNGAFALAYHELMAEFGVQTVRSDFKMSGAALEFWGRLAPQPPTRKLTWAHEKAVELEMQGEPEPPEEMELESGETVWCELQNVQFLLTTDSSLWADGTYTEPPQPWTWCAPTAVLKRLDEVSWYFEAFGHPGGPGPAAIAASKGVKLARHGSNAIHVGPFEDTVLLLPGPIYRTLMHVPLPQRDRTLSSWVSAFLDDIEADHG